MKRILLSIITITLVSAFAFSASQAFFSDTETSSNNTFTAGAIDLLINGQNDPDALVNITDLKPGDEYFINKELFVQNDAYVFLHLTDLKDDQGIQTEPEILEEDGTPKSDLQNYLTYDLSFLEGDVLIDFDDQNLLPEVTSCWIPLGIIPGGETTTIVQSFHFPDTITNWAQGDTLTFTEEFYAEQARNNPNPTPPDTGSGRVWDPIGKNCVNCEEGTAYASEAIESSQGLRKNNTAVLLNRSDSQNALGSPDSTDLNDPKWFSLGFGGSITLKFNFPVLDGTGDDLSFHEVTGGRNTYPLESATVEVSPDGTKWTNIGNVNSEPGGDGVVYLDIAGAYASIQYVRITDTTNAALHDSLADGYDLDAVDAVYGTCSYQID